MKLGQWLGLICLVIVLMILWQFRQVLLLLFAAVVLSTALNSLILRLQRWGLPRKQSVLITLTGALAIAILFIILIVPTFINQFVSLVQFLPSGFDRVILWAEQQIANRPDWLAGVELPNTADLLQQLQPILRNVGQYVLEFFSNSLTAIVQVLFVLILSLMLLAHPQGYRNAFIVLFPSFYRRRADTILTKCEIALDNWLGGALISSSAVAALSGVGLWCLGLPFVLAQALLAGLLNFIPNIGPTISLVFPLIVAFQDAPWKAIAVFILYFLIQQFESYLLTPTIMAKQVSLLPAITLTAQIFFASFLGFPGLLLALPLTVVAKTWIQEALVKDILDRWHTDRQSTKFAKPHADNPQDTSDFSSGFSEELAIVEFMIDPAGLPSRSGSAARGDDLGTDRSEKQNS